MIIQSSLFLIKKDFIYTKNNLWLPSNVDCFSSFINQQFKEIIVPINFYQSKKDVFNFVFIARTIERTSPRAFFISITIDNPENCRYNRQKPLIRVVLKYTAISFHFFYYCSGSHLLCYVTFCYFIWCIVVVDNHAFFHDFVIFTSNDIKVFIG